jgi:hypothetical protein
MIEPLVVVVIGVEDGFEPEVNGELPVDGTEEVLELVVAVVG